jgi:hypothetical protein
MNLRRVERRLVAPFYLEMMGSNVTWLDKRTYGKLVRVGRKATSTQVRALLRGGSLTVDAWYEAAAESPDRATFDSSSTLAYAFGTTLRDRPGQRPRRTIETARSTSDRARRTSASAFV